MRLLFIFRLLLLTIGDPPPHQRARAVTVYNGSKGRHPRNGAGGESAARRDTPFRRQMAFTGSSIRTVVPSPGALFKAIVPPWL